MSTSPASATTAIVRGLLLSAAKCARQQPVRSTRLFTRSFSETARRSHHGRREIQTISTFRPHPLPEGIVSSGNNSIDVQHISSSDIPSSPFSDVAHAWPASSPNSRDRKTTHNNEQAEITAPHQSSSKSIDTASSPSPSSSSASTQDNTQTKTASTQPQPSRPRRKLRARKAAILLTPPAVEHLRDILTRPDPRMIRVGVKNRGCSGLAYHLEYVEKPGAFDEVVEQDGVKVLIDSKALFSIIGSEMDYEDTKLTSRFIFKNPNIKHECGCGESFAV